jgi:hypothetical protein
MVFSLLTKINLNSSNANSPLNIALSTLNMFNVDNARITKNNFFLDEHYFDNKYNNESEVKIKNFIFLKKPSFIAFYINNLVDVPVCFKKSLSLKRKNFELPLLKFCSLLMKQGKKEKIFKLFFHSFRNFDLNVIKNSPLFENNPYWLQNYILLNTLFVLNNKNETFFLNFTPKLDENNQPIETSPFFLKNERIMDATLFFKNNIIKKITSIEPVFAYFIYSVDKNIKKFSRGKSGKYVFI